MAGNEAPDMVNPVPARETELTFTAAVPDEVSVRVLVDVVFNVTLSKATVLALTVR